MQPGERVVRTQQPKPGFRIPAALAAATAVGSTIWAYIEYAFRARPSLLVLALAVVLFAIAATTLLAFRAFFEFPSVQGPRPLPVSEAAPVVLGVGTRRGFVALLASAFSSLLAILLLPLRSLGPRPSQVLRATAWRNGVRLLTADGVALRVSDVPPGGFTPVVPAASPDDPNSSAVLVRLRPSGQVRAYSRICTHAGCAVCVFMPDTSLLVCPCHHSTFDVAAGGRVVSGPASRPLPELPLAVDAEGRLVASDDFEGPIGPVAG